jgi:multisubunit Na+/H+ antiporter MnhE subunit
MADRRLRRASRQFSLIARGRPRALDTPLERAAFFAAWWLISFGLWVLLVFKTEGAEFVAGAIAATFSATAAEVVRAKGYAPFSPSTRWALALLRLPGEVVVDCFLIFRALARAVIRRKQIEGSFRCIHFHAAAGGDPRSQARLVVAKWLGCVGPNTVVVGFDEERDAVLVHQLVRSPRPPDIDPDRRLAPSDWGDADG